MKYSGWPEPGELVVGKVDEIADFGVFVDLDEYEGKRGLCHITEVASGWIKNVRDHVREGQTVVAKVLEVNESSQQIDLSIKDVNEHQRKEKIQEWKNEQKADKWMALAFGEDIADDRYQSIANDLLAEFGSLYDGFESAAIHGKDALDDVDLSEEEIEAIVQTARNNVSVPYVQVTGYVDLPARWRRRRHVKEALRPPRATAKSATKSNCRSRTSARPSTASRSKRPTTRPPRRSSNRASRGPAKPSRPRAAPRSTTANAAATKSNRMLEVIHTRNRICTSCRWDPPRPPGVLAF